MAANYAVVLVTYNRLELLRECLEQIENQTVPAKKIIVVNNASTDGTTEYLRKYRENDARYRIITCAENLGGAGGFEKGIQASVQEKTDCILMIDDDAILEKDYMEIIMDARKRYPGYLAFAGTVMTDGRIDTFHRRNIARPGLRLKNCPENCYVGQNAGQPFACDIASFCGMVVDRELVRQAGLPCSEYFIWFDDTEYSMRINRYTRFLVVPGAVLNHKAAADGAEYLHRRYDWREYYGIRNRILCVKKHGNVLDRAVNGADMFCHIVFRNWLFGVVNMDGYDWRYEKRLVREAYKDARSTGVVRKGIPKF
ncbi:MAG: glycosyltransferase [Lachnospiraceae bacterium]|nr:glycosyltransferase [Lachnospiraceae bacterium]